MRIPGRKALGTTFRWVRSRFQDRALILGYHRIVASGFDPYDLCVSPENFQEQLEELLRLARPIRLSHLVTGLAAKTVEPGTVALTFDDAYLETLHVVEPILAEYEIPATVFATTSTLGQELWWDRLHRVLLTPAVLPKQLDIRIGSFVFDWASGPRLGPDDGSDTRQGREELLMNLYRRLIVAPEEDREGALEHLREWAGVSMETPPDSRVVSRKELADLAESPLIDIGSHTVSHPMMARLSREGQELEVGPSRTFLEDLLGKDVSLFSYPNGSCNLVSEELVREAGFAGACASRSGVALANGNRYRLPRFWPSDSPNGLSSPLHLWLGQ